MYFYKGEEMVFGFKCFDKGLVNSYGVKFEEGKIYETCGEIKFGLWGNGYHMCKNIEDTLRYFDGMNMDVDICSVLGMGNIDIYNDDYNGYYDMYSVEKIKIIKLLTRDEIPYIATNPDYVCPTEFGSVPDCGSVCDMIYNATKKRPLVIGKPEPLMPQLAMQQHGYTKEETAVIGDRIYTDIKSGLNAGVTGILVMSGETTQEILDASEDKPHMVLKDAGEMIPML